jgi:phage-related protein
MGIVNGIKSCIGAVGEAAKSVADKIKSFLHFSVPDEGPLTDYETWMPDFMGGLAKGIEKSRNMITKAVDDVAQDMVINPKAQLNMTAGEPGDSSGSSLASAMQQGIIGPLVEVREMTVRSDNDIRRISQELNSLMQSGRRAHGIV